MLDIIARYPLAPVLIWQGLKLRRTALILPEAEGPRSGTQGQGKPMRLLIVGDSSAAGVGVQHQCDALSGRLVHHLHAQRRVTWQLWAKTGATTQQTLGMLERKPQDHFDVIVIALGVNDVTRGVRVARWRAQQAQLRDVLRGKFGAKQVFVTAMPPLGSFPALSGLLRWILGAQARRFDAALRADVAKEPGAAYFSFASDFDPSAMAQDGFHPGAAVYDAWGRQLAEQMLKKQQDEVP